MFISEGTIVTEGSEIYVAKTSASNKDKKITKLSLKKPAHLLADKKEKAKQNKKRTDVTNEIKTNLIYRYPAHNHFFYAGSFAKSCVVIQGNDRPKMPAPPENFYTLSDIKAENNIKTQFFIYGMSPGQKGIFTKRYCRPPPKSFS
ncbi:hypothetical protein LUD75_19005 [Epilithonimonas sp. JDS]|uniref:hypothetical protein n=1 Tax=Epilithonimonas sp. JDS TaxID=2902797 RepID=UPI001E4A0CAF|nr:hypothetical protein [Epilithonimonas sp. JDS]MCD9856821.1 hypothetical protein [Epilithonimonas sp. JDS]